MALNVGELYASFGIDTKGLDKQISGIQKQCQSIGKGMALAGAGLTAAITAPLVKAGKAVYSAGTSFEAQMSKVEAISGASGEALEALTVQALEMGSTTKFTATEAGQALEYMAMAGWKNESMLAGLEPIMNLAAAAGEDLGTTSDIVTDAMTAMGYTLSSVGGDTEKFNQQVTHFTDVLSAAATNANTNVSLMGESFKYVAPLAGTLGFSIDDVAVALGTMANAGIKGSQAGTSLRNILNNMIKPTKAQEKALKRLGLSLTDSNGKTKSFGEIMGDMRKVAKESGIDMQALQKSVGELDEKLANGEITEGQYNKEIKKLTKGNAQFLKDVSEIAGTRGLSGMLAIMNATDEEFDSLTESVLHCDGATAKMAQTMLDNAQGDVTIFKSALEGLAITLWTDVAPAFREVVQSMTEYVDKFRKTDKATRVGTIKMLALAAAAGPAMAALGGIVSFLPQIGAALAGLASPLGIVTIGLGLFAAAAISTDNDVGKAFESMATSAAAKLNDMDKTIGETMQGISDKMPAVIQSVTNGLGELIPAAVQLGLDVITGFMDAITDNADGIVGVSSTIITSFLLGLAEKIPTLISSAATMIASIGVGLILHAPDILSAAGEVGLSIIKGIISTDWLGLAGQLVDAIGNAFGKMDENATTFGDKIGELINDQLTPEKIGKFFTNAGEVAVKLIGLIAEGIVSATTHASELITAIGNMLTEALNGDLLGDLSGVGISIINALAAAIKKAAGGAASLIKAIGSLISTALEGNTIGDLSAVGQAILTALINGIKSILDAGAQIATALGEAMAGINWADVGVDLANFAIDLIGALIDAITTQDFSGVMEAIGGGLGTAVGSLGVAAQNIVSTLIDYLLNPASWVKFGTGLLTIIEGAFNGIFSFLDSIAEEMGLKVETVEDQIRSINGLDSDLFFDTTGMINVEYTLVTAGEEERGDVAQWLQDAGIIEDGWTVDTNGFVNYTITPEFENAELYGKYSPEYNEYVDRIKQMIEGGDPVDVNVPITPEPEPAEGPDHKQQALEMIESNISEGLKEQGITTELPTIEATVGDVDVTTGTGTGLQTATQEKVNELAQQTFTASVDVQTAVNVTITDSNGFEVGQEVSESIKKGAASGVVGGASMAFSAGANFAKGYANGIESQISTIANKAAEMVRAAIRAANAAQDSGSPSRVMEQVGNWYGQGYVRGIVSQIRYVRKAAGGMADSAVNALTMRSNATPALAMAGGMNARDSMDYDRLAYAMSQQPAPVLDLNGKRVAEINSNNTAVAQNSRSRNIATRYGSR